MATAAIIQITGSRGASIKKSAARIVGTLTGGLYVLFIASATLIDSWLFNAFLIFGIVTSLGIASYFHNRVSYMFAVVGITLSLVGFPLAVNPDMANLFDHVQLRCVGIAFGILMSMVAGMVIPYPDDHQELSAVKKYTQGFLNKLFLSGEDSSTTLIRGFLVFVSKKWQLVDDEIYGSRHEQQDKLSSRAAFYDSINIGVRAIELKQLGDQVGMTKDAWALLIASRFNIVVDEEFRQQWQLAKTSRTQMFAEQVVLFSQQLARLTTEEATFDYSKKQYVSDIGRFTDGLVVVNNMLRAAVALFALSFMWIELQWEDGMTAMIMAGMIFSVYAANPGAEQAQSANFYAQLVAGVFGFIVTFGVMPIGSPWLVAVASFIGVYLMAYWYWQSKSLLKVVCMVSLFSWTNLVPLTSTPSFDFAHFLNSNVANITALMVMWCSFQLIPVRSTAQVIKRELRVFFTRFQNTNEEARKALNISNWILAAYAYLVSESDTMSINRMLFLKALQTVVNENKISEQEKQLLLSSVNKELLESKTNEETSLLIEDKRNTAAMHDFNWFILCERYRLLNQK
ncbi:hypothetical protein JCM19240_4778 [Vibrio maritimus]|uniref:FUSC family protein n=1 Tax=Vibrio maritimus TaxID=990268 RepID=A0A090T991_9VIBR|nr:hypothetical protein JCM19240_4778 [Vibrio maritimus]